MKKYEMSALIFLFKSAQNKSNMPNFKLCDVNFFIMYESVLSSLALEIFKISGMIGVWYHIFKLLKPYPKKHYFSDLERQCITSVRETAVNVACLPFRVWNFEKEN